MLIGVIGGGQCSAKDAELAEAVGRGLARRGVTLVCGGLWGVMEAACKGAKLAGGTTIGILPGDDRHAANPYVDIPIVTGLGQARNVIVVKSSQAIIAIHGSYGTLSEIASAHQSGIPVVGINTWGLFIDGQTDASIVPAEDAEDAVEKAIDLAKALEKKA